MKELLSKYCRIVDCKDYDDFDKVFSSTARIEIVIQGLKFNSVQPFKDFLNETKPFSEDRMHTTSNLSLEMDGEAASGAMLLAIDDVIQGSACHGRRVVRTWM